MAYTVPGQQAVTTGQNTFTGVSNPNFAVLQPQTTQTTYADNANQTEWVGGVGGSALWNISAGFGDFFTRPNVQVQAGSGINPQTLLLVGIGVLLLLALFRE
jgi:hypothetical protein